MKHLNRIVAGLLLAVSISFVPVASSFADDQQLKAAPIQPHIEPRNIPYVDEIMISVKKEYEPAFSKPLSAEIVQNISKLAGVRLKYVRNGTVYHLLRLPKKGYEAEAEALCEMIKHDERVIWCEINAMTIGQSATSPNDPIYLNGLQWNLRNESPAGIDAVSAWQITPGSANTVIAILDGGIIPHTDISASRLLPGYNFVTDAASASDGAGRDADPTDFGDWSVANGCPTSSWHGTAVAGVIGASTDNGFGIAGINQLAKLLPVQVLGKCKKGVRGDLVDAIRWASGSTVTGVPTNTTPAKVINISLSISSPPGFDS